MGSHRRCYQDAVIQERARACRKGRGVDRQITMRDIPVGNGRLLVNFDSDYQIRDIYFPHVGQENHTEGFPFRFGIWVDGEFSWIFSDAWKRTLRYLPETLVTDVRLE